MISDAELKNMEAPIDVIDAKGHKATITGFTENDPLGVGGGLFPDMPTVHFKNGGWLLVADFAQHYTIAADRPGQDHNTEREQTPAKEGK